MADGDSAAARNHGLDKLRAFCMLGIIGWHCANPYRSNLQTALRDGWLVKDISKSELIDTVMWLLSNGFFLRAFFCLAGFFACFLFHRRGLTQFFLERAQRIVLPLVVASFIFSHLIALVSGHLVYKLLHLWFLWYLTWIYPLAVLAAYGFGWLSRSAFGARLDRGARALFESRLAPLGLAIPTSIALYVDQNSRDPFDSSQLWPPVDGFIISPTVLAYYGVFFGVGWLLQRHAGVIPLLAKRGLVFIALALAVRLFSHQLYLRHVALGVPDARYNVALIVMGASFSWLAVLGAIGLFAGALNRSSKLARYIADASYWCYIVHVIPALIIGDLISQLHAPALLKWVFVMATSLAICLVSYEYLVRYTIVGTVLNGKRTRPPGGRWRAWTADTGRPEAVQ